MKNYIIILCFLILIPFSVINAQIIYKGFPEWAFGQQGSTQYYIYTPQNLEPGEVYPIAVFFHGCCGENNNASLRNAVDPPVRMWHNFGKNEQKVPTYIISPATQSGWSQHFDNLVVVINDLIDNHQGDSTRIYVTGFSMGGTGTYGFIEKYPDLFAAAIPMGMAYTGTMEKTKNIPFWANVGEADNYGEGLDESVAIIRALNGDPRGYDNWVTGVNPRLTIFEGVGHGVQWDAASKQDLVGWAFEHVNDGNYYPNVYFSSPDYGQVFSNSQVPLEIKAFDNDGTIESVEIYVNEVLVNTLTESPFNTTVDIRSGDNIIKASAFDNGGKKRTATILVKTDTNPRITTAKISPATQGALYKQKINVSGNAGFTYSIDPEHDPLPDGIVLTKNGLLKGIPQIAGTYNIQINVTDAEEDFTYKQYELTVNPKDENTLVVTDVSHDFYTISKIYDGELPHYSSDNEINFSDISVYGGYTFIALLNNNLGSTAEDYLSFTIDDPATVLVAYESMGTTSTIPSWLNEWTKQTNPQIVAQYRYFDVYAKDFPSGTVTLPGPDATTNGVATTYFVMLKGVNAAANFPIRIDTEELPKGYAGIDYIEQITVSGGQGELTWEVSNGSLPEGFSLLENGVIKGYTDQSGDFEFELSVSDEYGNSDSQIYQIEIGSSLVSLLKLEHLDEVLVKNIGEVDILIIDFALNDFNPEDYTLSAYFVPEGIVNINHHPEWAAENAYFLKISTIYNVIGETLLFLKLTDNNNPDDSDNSTISPIKIKVIPFVNNPPQSNTPEDIVTSMDFKKVKFEVLLTGLNDGDDGSQNMTITTSYTNRPVLSSPTLVYNPSDDFALFSFYPRTMGSTKVTFLIKDNGGSDLGGNDSLLIDFNIDISKGTFTESNTLNDISIFPNPARDEIYVSLPGNRDKALVNLYNMNGKLILSKNIKSKDRIDLKAAKSGTYIMKIITENITYQKSLIIEE